ncbi:neprilysin-3-like isoform X2 [Tigriopus californicus]|uniref:neprilysin-3-like isoform X2 n=1 Tax=Tigriopus californicus TaxID=6832 RepID=UPI0027DAB304|nr:neprilysin-3-like isoform X2 [Tigriopus californicus]
MVAENSSEDPRVLLPTDHPDFQQQLRRVSRYKKALSVLSFTLLCLSVILAILLWKSLSGKDSRSKNTVPETINNKFVRNSSQGHVCLTPECILAASTLIESIDHSVDPCEDFYGFACNGWIEKHSIPRGQPQWSVTDQMTEDNLEILRSLLERPLDNMASKSEQKSQLLYRSCVDSNGVIERLGSEPLDKLITSIGGWNLTKSEFNPATFDLKSKLLLVQKYSTNALFHWYVREGTHDTNQYDLIIQQGGISLPFEDFYWDSDKTNSLVSFMSTVVERTNGGQGDPKEIRRQVQEVVELERQLADIGMPEEEMMGKYLTLDEVDELVPSEHMVGSWKDFFGELAELFHKKTRKPSISFNGDTRIWVQYDYIVKLADIVRRPESIQFPSTVTPSKRSLWRNNILNNYLTWQAIQPYIGFLAKDYQKAEHKFMKAIYGIQGREERWRTCVKATNSAMGFAVAPLFIHQRFSQEGKDLAYDMIEEVKETFKRRLEKLDWLDPQTKTLVKEKISNIKTMMGYPDYIMDNKALDRAYESFKVKEHRFFQNQLRFNKFVVQKNLDLFQTKVDKDYWLLISPPTTVNAYYAYSRGQVIFPAGVLQPPLFTEKQPMALNFGHIGTLMGHELLHGFDDIGRLYGPSGHKRKWWPNRTTNAFNSKSRCFVKQYSQKIFSGWNVNGERTLSENIADNGGLISAYQAYQRICKSSLFHDERKSYGTSSSNWSAQP